MVAMVSVPVVGLSVSFPLAIVVPVSVVSVVAISMVAIVSVVRCSLSLPLAIVESVSVVSKMAVSVMTIAKVSVSVYESVVSVVSVVSVRRGFSLSFSLAEYCGNQEESEEHLYGLHVCGCEQARDPSRTPH